MEEFIIILNRIKSLYTLKNKIVALIILMVFVPMAVAGIFFYGKIYSALSGNAYNNLDQTIYQLSSNIESSFTTFDNSCIRVLSGSTIRKYIFDENLNTESESFFEVKSSIDSELRNSIVFDNAWNSKLMSTLYLFFGENDYCSISRNMGNFDTEYKNNVNIYKTSLGANKPGLAILPPSASDARIYFVRGVNNLNTSKLFAYLVIGMDENTLYEKYCKNLEYPDSKIIIYDNQGTIYLHSDQTMLGKKVEDTFLTQKNISKIDELKINDETYYFAHKKIFNNGLNLVVMIPKKQVLLNLSASMRDYLSISVVIIFVSLLMSIAVSLALSGYIRHLINNIKKIRSGNYDTRMPVYKDSDLNELSTTFNSMAEEIQYLIKQVYEKQLLLKETDLKFLHSQMNPHFLFNALATIGYNARLANDEVVYKMVTSLSVLLQAGIYSEGTLKIPVHQELEYAKFYLYLQKVRFGERLEYTINISDDSINHCLLPKFCIEPIVENSVVHGLENKLGNGNVTINAFRDENSLYFEVIDDGVGFEAGLINLEDHGDTRRGHHDKAHNNIALYNTNKRIKIMYGDDFGISVKSRPGKGTKVVLHIPVDQGDDENV